MLRSIFARNWLFKKQTNNALHWWVVAHCYCLCLTCAHIWKVTIQQATSLFRCKFKLRSVIDIFQHDIGCFNTFIIQTRSTIANKSVSKLGRQLLVRLLMYYERWPNFFNGPPSKLYWIYMYSLVSADNQVSYFIWKYCWRWKHVQETRWRICLLRSERCIPI